MYQEYPVRYFFSIQPFWGAEGLTRTVRSDSIDVSRFDWDVDALACVPGNGQVGFTLSGPEDFAGYCFGVMDQRDEIPMYGIKKGYFVRFTPGTFTALFRIPAPEIPARGIGLAQIFLPEELARIKDAIAGPAPQEALLCLFECWDSVSRRAMKERSLADQAVQMIWSSRGSVRMKNMEQETGYCARRLQEVVTRQVGVGPKQLCRQTRFQNALRLLSSPLSRRSNQAEMAQLLGYSDQAHYSREFKEFAGFSPSQFQKMCELG